MDDVGVRVGWRRLAVVMLVLAVVSGCASDPGAGPAPSDAPWWTAEVDPEMDPAGASEQLLAGTLKVDEPGCSATVGVDGVVAWHGARGLASLITGEPISASTVFDVGGITQQFTAVAVLLLAQEGWLATTDPVGAHLPGLPAWAQDTTLDSLLRHTSGLPTPFQLMADAGFAYDRTFTQDDAMRLISGITETSPRRGDHVYSETGYVLLAEVVRVVSGQSYEEFVQQRIFGPLGLTMTMGHMAAVEGEPMTYRRESTSPSGFESVLPMQYAVVGASGLRTTTSELVRWGDNYRTGAVGGQALVDAQLAGPVLAGREHYGSGIFVFDTAGKIGHDGWWDYGFSEFRVSADRRVTVAVSCNAELSRSLADTLITYWS